MMSTSSNALKGFKFRPLLRVLLCVILGAAPWRIAAAGPYSALVVELESERILYAQNADELRHPASLTKMMTLYLLFEALARGEISLEDPMRVSAYAVSKPPSRLGLRAGETLTVEEGIYGLVTQSANDAATVIAETLGGTESEFAMRMTQRARQLGMSNTVFYNASGLPNPNQVTSAWDMYRLGKALLKHFPQYYHYFSTGSFWFRDREFKNHNHLLENYPGTDGIKTGFVNSSGFNLVASARRNGSRLIGVVFGGNTHARRDAHMRELLDDGFAQLEGQPSTIQMAGFDPPPRIHASAAAQPESLLGKPRRENRQALAAASQPQALKAPKTPEPKPAAKKAPSWQVHVGEFPQEKSAERRLSDAMKAAPYAFRHARGAVAARAVRGKKLYRVYFSGLSKEDAALACQFLKRKGLECSTFLTES